MGKVWVRHQSQFRSAVSRILLDKASIDDVIQEAFTRVLQSGRSFHDDLEAYKYMRRVVVNTTIDYYRHCRRHYARFRSHQDPTTGICAQREDDSTNPFRLLAGKEEADIHSRMMDQVKDAMNELSPSHLEAIRLVFQKPDHKTLKEVCREEGIPYSTLRSRTVAAIDRIREKLMEKNTPAGQFQAREEVR